MHFKRRDPVMAPVVVAAFSHTQPISLRSPAKPAQYFKHLAESIVSQQLSVKAADTIWGRLVKLVGGKVTPDSVLKQNVEKLRKC